MANRPEARVIAKERRDGKVEISVVDPKTGRDAGRTITANRGEEAARLIRQTKETFEKGRNYVSVVER